MMNRTIIKRVLIGIGILAIILVAAYLTLLAIIIPHTTHSLWRYKALRGKMRTELVAHFPMDIPRNARRAKLSFYPGFLQGGSHFQIRYQLPSPEIIALYEKYSRLKTQSYFGGNGNDHMNQSNGMPTTSFYTGSEKYGRFPNDYEIMIFDAVLTNRPPGFYWNHGQSHGVAISTSRNDIVYWAESW